MGTPSDAATSNKVIQLNATHTHASASISQREQPTALTAATLPAERFKYRGRTWRIFKRSSAEAARWQLYFEANKKRHSFSLGTSSKQGAIAEAKLKIDLHFEKRESALRSSMARPNAGRYSTIAAVLAAVPQLPIDANQVTRQSYAWSLLWVLRLATGLEDAAVLKLGADVLSDDTARRFFERVTEQAAELPAPKAETHKRNAITFYDNSRALFAPRALRALRHTFNLHLPDIADWRAGKVHAPKITGASEFTPPPQAVERRTLIEWVRMGRTRGYRIPGASQVHGDPLSELDRRNTFIAIGLALSFGFRKGDVKRARWNWFDRDEAGPLCRVSDVTQKNRQSTIEISAVDPFWRVLNFWIVKNGWTAEPAALCLEARAKIAGHHGGLQFSHGGACDRYYWPFWLVGKWLRWLGWTTQKTNHALRDLVASKLTMKYGLDVAKEWCRHEQQATTEAHYSRFRRRSEQTNPKKLAWIRWAK